MPPKLKKMKLDIGTTLDEFIIRREKNYPDATGDLSKLLRDIGVAAKLINRSVNKAGLVDIIGAVGETNIQGEDVYFDFNEESDGTRKFIAFIGPWIDSLERGNVLVIDELHDNFHPLMVKFLIELFLTTYIKLSHSPITTLPMVIYGIISMIGNKKTMEIITLFLGL